MMTLWKAQKDSSVVMYELNQAFKTHAKFRKNAILTFTENGLTVETVTKDHVSMLRTTIETEEFDELKTKPGIHERYVVNIRKLSEIIKHYSAEDKVTLEYGQDMFTTSNDGSDPALKLELEDHKATHEIKLVLEDVEDVYEGEEELLEKFGTFDYATGFEPDGISFFKAVNGISEVDNSKDCSLYIVPSSPMRIGSDNMDSVIEGELHSYESENEEGVVELSYIRAARLDLLRFAPEKLITWSRHGNVQFNFSYDGYETCAVIAPRIANGKDDTWTVEDSE